MFSHRPVLELPCTDEQAKERFHCQENFVYFVWKYVVILDVVKGPVPFRLYKRQRDLAREWQEFLITILLKCRQMGVTWLAAAFCLWLAMFYHHKNILVVSLKDRVAKRFLWRVKFIYKRLPIWLQAPITGEFIASSVEFQNGSRIESIPTSDDAGRTEGVYLFVIEEFSWLQHAEMIWGSAMPTVLHAGSRAIVIGTANGMDNQFYEKYMKALANPKGPIKPLRMFWYDFPGRDQKWHDRQFEILGPWRCAQEIDGDFVASGTPYFDIASLRALEEDIRLTKPLRTERNNTVLIFSEPKPGRNYHIGADTATGEANSWNAAAGQAVESNKTAFEIRTKLSPIEFAALLYEIGERYFWATVTVERNYTGIAVIQELVRRGYPYLYLMQNLDPETRMERPLADKPKIGWITTASSKQMLIAHTEREIRDNLVDIKTLVALNEFYSFQGATLHAPGTKNDDLVMGYSIMRFTKAEAFRQRLELSVEYPVFCQ